MKRLRRLSFERLRRSSSFERSRLPAAPPDAARATQQQQHQHGDWRQLHAQQQQGGRKKGPLTADEALQLIAELHGPGCGAAVVRLLGACASRSGAEDADGNATAASSCQVLRRAGGAAVLPSLLQHGPGAATDEQQHQDPSLRAWVLELLSLLAADHSSAEVHCQMVFVGLVEALVTLLGAQRPDLARQHKSFEQSVATGVPPRPTDF
jgi:hypothetical protein